MRVVVEPPVTAAGQRFRAVVAVDVAASRLGRAGIMATGGKYPLAVVAGSGVAARLIGFDGEPCSLATLGLTRRDIE